MFLFDPTFGSAFEKCEGEVRRLMDRASAELLFCRKWDERRLAYRIRGRKRGVYVLTYFKADTDKITPLERDAKLSENILRLLVLRADDVTPEYMERMVSSRAESSGERGDREESSSDGPSGDKPSATNTESPKETTAPAEAEKPEGESVPVEKAAAGDE